MINHSTTVELDVAAGSCAEFVSSHKATNAAQKGPLEPLFVALCGVTGELARLCGETQKVLATAVAFVVHAPGPPMENFSREAALAATDPPDMDALLAIAQRHGIELLGPIPALVDA